MALSGHMQSFQYTSTHTHTQIHTQIQICVDFLFQGQCLCHCAGTAGLWYVSGLTRADLPQDVWRVWCSVLTLQQTNGNRTHTIHSF